jgi:hypothetical protein
MGVPEIVSKVDSLLALHSPVTEECHVVYFMVECRKILDQENLNAKLPALKFYADWTVHTRKDRISADMKLVLGQIHTEVIQEIRARETTIPARTAIRSFVYMEALSRDIGELLTSYHLPLSLTADRGQWIAFVKLLVKVLENQPIIEPVAGIKEFCFLNSADGCVIGHLAFEAPVDGFPHYNYMNAY